MFSWIKKIPGIDLVYRLPGLMSAYHFLLSFIGALRYGFPAYKLKVIGITGTKGKTTTATLVHHLLSSAGIKTGLATTVLFSDGRTLRVNDTKQTMLGRFGLQKLLAEMVRNGCTHAVIETSSEGILQHRHRFLNYRLAVFTNISPEHIERHGSFENYLLTKTKLFRIVAARKNGIGFFNIDDPNVGRFLSAGIHESYGYGIREKKIDLPFSLQDNFIASDIVLSPEGSKFKAKGGVFETRLIGEMNVYNALVALSVAEKEGVSVGDIKRAFLTFYGAPGRMERLQALAGFVVFVDYAHEPASLKAAYEAAHILKPNKLIGLLGSQGGGRDVWKREAMGKIAGDYCDVVILTNEDPYDEDPQSIIEGVAIGVAQSSKKPELYKIIDRREAIKKAISLAGKGDVVILTGKGGEVWMCVENDKKIPWNDKEIVEEILSR